MAGKRKKIYIAGDMTTDVLIKKGTRKHWDARSENEAATSVHNIVGGIGWACRLLREWSVGRRNGTELIMPGSVESALKLDGLSSLDVEPRVYYVLSERADERARRFVAAAKEFLENSSGAEHEFNAVSEACESARDDAARVTEWTCTEELGFGEMTATNIWDPGIPSDIDLLYLYDVNLKFRSAPVPGKSIPKRVLLNTVWPFPEKEELGGWMSQKEVGKEAKVAVTWLHYLRQAVGNVSIDRGNSWERTADDLINALDSLDEKPKHFLREFTHVVIMIGIEGAMVWEPESGKYTLFFDCNNREGEAWDLESKGWLPAISGLFETEIAFQIANAEPDKISDAVHVGVANAITATEKIRKLKHRTSDLPTLVQSISRAATQVFAKIDRDGSTHYPGIELDKSLEEGWTLVDKGLDDPGLAKSVATKGLGELSNIYHLRVGKLSSVDRKEIEDLSILQKQMLDYEAVKVATRPLSLGVFGDPGNGKSFAIKEIVKSSFGAQHPVKTYNLSQFTEEEGLTRAFQETRDSVLLGYTPVIIWDEFEAGGHKWLAKLLAPMQDGEFLDGGQMHPIGKCIFIFVGGVYKRFEEFRGYCEEDPDAEKLKAPDFLSRLSGSLDVSGPNKRDDGDKASELRRAILLRSVLELPEDEELDIEKELLTNLLEKYEFRYGARSFEKVVSLLKQHLGKQRLSASHLLPHELIRMQVKNYAAV